MTRSRNSHPGTFRIQQKMEGVFHYCIIDEQARAGAIYPAKQLLSAVVGRLSAEDKFSVSVNRVEDTCLVKWRGGDAAVKIAAVGEAGGTSFIQIHPSFDLHNLSTFTWSLREYDDELVADICGTVRTMFFASSLGGT